MSKLDFLPNDKNINGYRFYGEKIVDLSREDLLKMICWLGKENQRLTQELYREQDLKSAALFGRASGIDK